MFDVSNDCTMIVRLFGAATAAIIVQNDFNTEKDDREDKC